MRKGQPPLFLARPRKEQTAFDPESGMRVAFKGWKMRAVVLSEARRRFHCYQNETKVPWAWRSPRRAGRDFLIRGRIPAIRHRTHPDFLFPR